MKWIVRQLNVYSSLFIILKEMNRDIFHPYESQQFGFTLYWNAYNT